MSFNNNSSPSSNPICGDQPSQSGARLQTGDDGATSHTDIFENAEELAQDAFKPIQSPLKAALPTSQHPMVTRSKVGIRISKKKIFLLTREPKSVKEDLSNPMWKAAMEDEYKAVIRIKTCHLVEPPPIRVPI